jgi:Tol biopolymer transport system component
VASLLFHTGCASLVLNPAPPERSVHSLLRSGTIIALLSIALLLCLFGLWRASPQSGGLRRITVTSEEDININPTISGNGRSIAFESTENLGSASTADVFRAIRADIEFAPAEFVQISASRGAAPGISQDGSRTAFAARENPLGSNPDFNSEIFYFDGSTLRQITSTTPNSPSQRAQHGSFLPSLSDDGRFIAFASNRNLAGANADGNFEIFIFDV